MSSQIEFFLIHLPSFTKQNSFDTFADSICSAIAQVRLHCNLKNIVQSTMFLQDQSRNLSTFWSQYALLARGRTLARTESLWARGTMCRIIRTSCNIIVAQSDSYTPVKGNDIHE